MILDHIKYVENIDHETGNVEVRAVYTVDLSKVIDPSTNEKTKAMIKIKLAKEIQKETIRNLFQDFFLMPHSTRMACDVTDCNDSVEGEP